MEITENEIKKTLKINANWYILMGPELMRPELVSEDYPYYYYPKI